MLWEFVLRKHGKTSLAYHGARRMRERRGTRWLLPGDYSSAVDEGGERVAVVARALSVYSCCLLAVFVDCAGSTCEFALVPI